MQPEEEGELEHELQGMILHSAEGDDVAEIINAYVKNSGQELWLEVDEYGTGQKYIWTIDTGRVVGNAGTELISDHIRSTIDSLYTERLGSLRPRDIGRPYGGGEATGSVPPGPGDPELDL